MARVRQAEPGTVISGTLKNVDLIPAFLDVLRECNAPEYEQILMQPMPIPPSHALEDPRDKWWDSERASDFVQELFEVLEGYAPDGHTFGAHWGDASDFGFWPVEEFEGNARRYWTVVIPYSTRPTKWHPTERTGPFSTLTRGAFPSPEQAEAWAQKNLGGQPYRVERYQSPYEDDENLVPSEGYEGNAAPPEQYRALHERVWKAARREGYEPVETEWAIPMGQGVYQVVVLAPTQTGRKVVSVQVPYEGNAAPPPPPRRGKRDTVRRLARTMAEHERHEPPFDPETPPERYAAPHHFAVNRSYSKDELLRMMKMDGGMFDSYIRSFSGADQAESEYFRLRRLFWVDLYEGKPATEAREKFIRSWRSYAAQNNAKVAAAPKIKRGPSRGHSAMSHRWVSEDKAETDVLVLQAEGMAPNASRRERTRSVLAGEPDPNVDEQAADELELYLENDPRFALFSPEGMGRAVRDNLLKKIQKGTYDHTLAPKAWLHVVDAAAQAYAKEFDDPKRWHVLFNAPTRRFNAQRLADSFFAAHQSGEFRP